MLTEHRQEVILNIINEKGSVTVSELREKFGISESTARRDLTELDRAGKLTKVFGGAIAAEGAVTTTELSVTQKLEVNIDEKMKIAKYAGFQYDERWNTRQFGNNLIININDLQK